jgi:hypothetical protein
MPRKLIAIAVLVATAVAGTAAQAMTAGGSNAPRQALAVTPKVPFARLATVNGTAAQAVATTRSADGNLHLVFQTFAGRTLNGLGAISISFLGIGTPFVRRNRRGDRALEDALERNLRPLGDLADGGGSSLELAEDDLVGLQQDRAEIANGLATALQGGGRDAETLVERLQVALDDSGPVALAHEADGRRFHHAFDARSRRGPTKGGKPYEIGCCSRASRARASWARERIPSLR